GQFDLLAAPLGQAHVLHLVAELFLGLRHDVSYLGAQRYGAGPEGQRPAQHRFGAGWRIRSKFAAMPVLPLLEAARAQGRKLLAVLIDPDFGADEARLEHTVQQACMAKADLILVGGSLLTTTSFDRCVELVRRWSDRPVVLFPGSPAQLSRHADAVLFLSLISGRNPELLIGHHVTAAPTVKALGIEAIPTGYMLVDGG